MSDLRTRLERLGERARPVSGAFERLERVRRRRERNRRLAAGVVALLIAVAGSLAAFAALRTAGRETVGGGAESFLAIWPESTFEDALAVQDAVAAGDQTLSWRLDASQTALAFAHQALGWTDATVDDVGLDDATSVVVRAPGGSCPSQTAGCAFPRDATIQLRTLEGPGTIWSVVSARSEQFQEIPAPGTEFVVASDLVLSEAFPPASGPFYVAFVGIGACAGWEHDVSTPPGELALTVPALPDGHPDGCPVALLVLRPDGATPQGLGRQLLEYGFSTALWHVLAVPVRIVPQAIPPTVPDVAAVTCDGSSISVDTPIVRAQSDGVHLTVAATEGTSFSIEQDSGLPGSDGATSASSGQGLNSEPDAVMFAQVGPGRYLLTCRETGGGASDVVGTAPLEVLDPAGYYVSAELECSGGGAYGMAPAYAEGAVGDVGTPVEVARTRLTGLGDGDAVERAGYPAGAAEPVVRIVRAGVVVGRIELFDDGQGGWLLSSLEGCGGTSFGWSETSDEAGPYPRGAFAWCPEPPFAPLGPVWSEQASNAAVRFVEASAQGDEAALAALLDSSVPQGAELPVALTGDAPVVIGTEGQGSDLVRFGCGDEVAASTAAVTIDDGTDSSSLDFTVFLVPREDGWKVWAVY